LVFEDFFISIGTFGLLVGLLICIIYFTIGYSYLTKGQTIGKKAVNIQVITKDGKFLALEKSFLRAVALFFPFFLINLKIPGIEEDSLLFVLINAILLITLVGILFIYIFNKATRQTLHDFVAKSFVTENREQESQIDLKKINPAIIFVYGMIAFFLLGLSVFNTYNSKNKTSSINIVYKKLSQLNGVVRAGTSDNTTTFYGNQNNVTHSFNGILWVQNLPQELNKIEESAIVKDAVRIIFESNEDISEFDFIRITLIRGFNIGIARKTRSYYVSKSPEEWKEIVN